MEYVISVLLIISGMLAFNEISILKRRVKSQEDCLNQLCKLTGHDNLSSYWVSDELKELAIHLKRTGKEVEAIKRIREQTQMSLIEAKQYVEKLD
ncbi:50S ribosomal protein L7/L12 [Clostridium sardiniense]|uniref:50S ribosomal protein L7/L12 n=1 Tax=Clostridium sardiniense TaxID=29369 RepID=A0ABS7KTE6_CLOSR|nr:50S ribosomal protein L7/L12 [Clostridium sardiniense]MBY0754040.1 50S ribosomal protein L7/L12 [Clostridium sardiniense]MDQ0459441.1 ribosomal protein L7/L12 [Clostridium sardiniense]